MKTISIVLPIHNGAEYLHANVERLTELLPTLASEFQIVIVDDGSHDGSEDLIAELANTYPQVTAVFHSKHQGERLAIESGLKRVRNKLVFIQAAKTIEESKIRAFASQESRSHTIPEPEEEAPLTTKSSEAPLNDDSTFESTARSTIKSNATEAIERNVEMPDNSPLENQLVEKLMQWGVALRTFQQQLEPNLDKAIQRAKEAGNVKEASEDKLDKEVESASKSLLLVDELESPSTPKPAVRRPVSTEDRLNTQIEALANRQVRIRQRTHEHRTRKISAPKFSSIPEKRLLRLSQHDLQRHARAFS